MAIALHWYGGFYDSVGDRDHELRPIHRFVNHVIVRRRCTIEVQHGRVRTALIATPSNCLTFVYCNSRMIHTNKC